ncbi:Rab family GTPase [Sporobolomyces koalae]|uniref:Rab family GTPase n=1 Tax=Sporobolomyces koalae TaxID=500713 RepID=UPI0031764B37
MAEWSFIQKQILLGDAATGKSSLLVRLTDDRFLQHSEPTIGVEFGSRLIALTEGPDAGKKIKLQIWDTAGQESFRAITRSYYRGAGGALLCFSLTSHQSFHNLKSWLNDLRSWGEEDLLILVVGNKGDITTELQGDTIGTGEKREVTREEAEEWVKQEGLAGYVECSAKNGQGVEEAFNTITRLVHETQRKNLDAKAAKNGNYRGNSIIPSLDIRGTANVFDTEQHM